MASLKNFDEGHLIISSIISLENISLVQINYFQTSLELVIGYYCYLLEVEVLYLVNFNAMENNQFLS